MYYCLLWCSISKEVGDQNMEYDSFDEDLISHITKQQHTEPSSELDKYLKIDYTPVLGIGER